MRKALRSTTAAALMAAAQQRPVQSMMSCSQDFFRFCA